MSFTISNDLFSAQAECSLTSFQLKSSRLAQDFCSEAIAWAPLCGMMLGRIAAPLVRFRSAQLFSSLGFNQTFSRFTSWGIGVSAEGTIMAAAPGVLMGQGLSPDLWRGSVHGTLTMMMAQGVARGIPMNGIIREVSQDLSFMAVNVVCGVAGITDKANGSFMEQYCEARIVSVRMKISGELVHSTCVEATYAQAKIEVQRKVEESIQRDSRDPRGWEGVVQEVTQLTGKSQLVDPHGRNVKGTWESSTQKILRESLTHYMKRKGLQKGIVDKDRQLSSEGLGVSLSLEGNNRYSRYLKITQMTDREFTRDSRAIIALYSMVEVASREALELVRSLKRSLDEQFILREDPAIADNPFYPSADPNEFFRRIGTARVELGKKLSLRSVIEEIFLEARISVTSSEGLQRVVGFLKDSGRAVQVQWIGDTKAELTFSALNSIPYKIYIDTNRVLRVVEREEGILAREELLLLQDEENDGRTVTLVKRKSDGRLIVQSSGGRGNTICAPWNKFLAHTHPWKVYGLSWMLPGNLEMEIAREQNLSHVGIYYDGLMIFHPKTELQIFGDKHYASRFHLNFFSGEEDYYISEKEGHVLITPRSESGKPSEQSSFPVLPVYLAVLGAREEVLNEGHTPNPLAKRFKDWISGKLT